MDVIEAIKKRRSVRVYLNRPVEDEKLRLCLEAVRLSPSACNLQPYKVHILTGEAKDKFCQQVFSGMYSACSFAAKAPVIIAFVSSKKTLTGLIGNQVQGTDFSLIDIGIAGEHLAIQAAALDLGTCWLGWFSKKKADKFLKTGLGERTEILMSLGYMAKETPARPRKKDDELFFFKEKI